MSGLALSNIDSQARYTQLKACPKITETNPEAPLFGETPNLGMDKWVVTVGNKRLGASGVGPYFVFCSRGIALDTRPILGMVYAGNLINFEIVLGDLIKQMSRLGCIQNSIETFVIGGEAPNEKNPDGSLEEEELILTLAEKTTIKGIRFNLPQEDDRGINVVFTPTEVIVSKKPLFTWTPGNSNTGTDIL